MSQSATFYRIEPATFFGLEKDTQFDWYSHQKGYATLSGTHEALRYLLKKKHAVSERFVDQLFYPKGYLEKGEPENENTPSEEAIFYHSPATAAEIRDFLMRWTPDDIRTVFHPAELNASNIYPTGWHHDESSQYAYNLKHLLTDFHTFQDFFSATANEQQYALVFIG